MRVTALWGFEAWSIWSNDQAYHVKRIHIKSRKFFILFSKIKFSWNENLIKYFAEKRFFDVLYSAKWPQIGADEHRNIIILIFYTPNYVYPVIARVLCNVWWKLKMLIEIKIFTMLSGFDMTIYTDCNVFSCLLYYFAATKNNIFHSISLKLEINHIFHLTELCSCIIQSEFTLLNFHGKLYKI